MAISSDLDLHQRADPDRGGGVRAHRGPVRRPRGDRQRRRRSSDFVTTGIDRRRASAIGDLPHGRGILRLLIDNPKPIRLDDLAQHPRSYGFPPNHPPMGTFLGVPVRIRGTVFGNLYLTEKDGGVRVHESGRAPGRALASAAGFVIENARAYGLSERRRQWLEASAELDEALQPPLELGRALRQVATAPGRIPVRRPRPCVQIPEPTPPRSSTVDGPAARPSGRSWPPSPRRRTGPATVADRARCSTSSTRRGPAAGPPRGRRACWSRCSTAHRAADVRGARAAGVLRRPGRARPGPGAGVRTGPSSRSSPTASGSPATCTTW